MKNALAFLMLLGAGQCFAQCPFAVALKSQGGTCAGADTLVVSGGGLASITWLNGALVDHTVTAAHDSSFASNGITVAGGNGQGAAANQFYEPSGICFDNSGNMYVADQFNYRVQKFPPGSTSATAGQTVAGGNGVGTAANQMQVVAICTDNAGYIYAADHENLRVLKFPSGSTSITNGQVVAGGNGQGGAANQFDTPTGVCTDGERNIYVADAYNGRIQKFPPSSTSATNGVTIAGGNGYGPATNQFIGPYALCIDHNNNIYIADYGNSRVLKFPPNSTSATNGIVVAGGNGSGTAANQLFLPFGVFVDGAGYIYVVDQGNNRIQKFPPNSTSATNGTTVAGGNGMGSAANQLNNPLSVWVDADGNIYVADGFNNRIQKFLLVPAGIDSMYVPAVAGTYRAVVTDSSGCTDTTNAIVVNPNQMPAVSINVHPDTLCAGSQVSLSAAAANAGAAPAYQWLVNGVPVGGNNPGLTTAAPAGEDTVACAVSGGPGCYATDTSGNIIVHVPPPPVLATVPDLSIQPGQSVSLAIPVTGNIVSYTWQPPAGLSSNTVANPVASPLQTTSYTLQVVSANGCAATGAVTVKVASPIYIPGAFTPNGDGRNDIFYVIGGNAGDRIKDFAVYGRWGQRLFHVQNVPPGDAGYGWGGYYNGLPQPTGAYVYIAVITAADGTEKVYKGSVVLVR